MEIQALIQAHIIACDEAGPASHTAKAILALIREAVS